VAAGRASRLNCSHVPVKVLPALVGTPESLNKTVNNVKFARSQFVKLAEQFLAFNHAISLEFLTWPK